MPSWKIHLTIADKLSLAVQNKDAFLLANVAPDIENGWILKHVSNKTQSSVTHFYNKAGKGQTLPSLTQFKNKHCTKPFNDITMGYYIHLMTDYFWNQYINKKHFVYDETEQIVGIKTLNGIVKGNKQFCTCFKQTDFSLFSNVLQAPPPPILKN